MQVPACWAAVSSWGANLICSRTSVAAERLPVEYLTALCFSVPCRRMQKTTDKSWPNPSFGKCGDLRVFFLLCHKGYSEIAVKNANSSSSAV